MGSAAGECVCARPCGDGTRQKRRGARLRGRSEVAHVSNVILPALPGLAWDNTTAPGFSTKIQTSVGGTEVRASFLPYPIRAYELVHEFLRQYTPPGGSPYTEMVQLYAFFCSRLGSFDSFLFDDPNDDSVTKTLVAVGDGATTVFQLGRTIGSGSTTFFEPVYNVNSAPLIYVNNVLKTVSVDYTLSATGLLTFTSAPGNTLPIQWTGTYYWRCRFEDDALSFTEFVNLFWEQRSLKFRTVLNA
jgi:uncharacterized protein (TIGR02217 family)